jgi:type I restriction enzyme, R subunit
MIASQKKFTDFQPVMTLNVIHNGLKGFYFLLTEKPCKFKLLMLLKNICCTFQVMKIKTKFQYQGINKRTIALEDQLNLIVEGKELKKLKEGKDVSQTEAEQLAEELHNEHPHITLDLLRRVYNHRKAVFVQFIKHILGIEILQSFPETVSKAFDDFISNHTYLTSRQLQFLDLLCKYIIENVDLTRKNLIESPFTFIHPEGIRGVFNPKEIDEILKFTEKLTAA